MTCQQMAAVMVPDTRSGLHQAALEFLLQTGRQPDILHCHDWSSAPLARAYRDDYHPYGLWKPKVGLTADQAAQTLPWKVV